MGGGVDHTDTPHMLLELPTLHEARGFVECQQAIVDQPGDGVDGRSILFIWAGWVTTKRGVVGVNEVVFHGDGDRVVDVKWHCASSLLAPGLSQCIG